MLQLPAIRLNTWGWCSALGFTELLYVLLFTLTDATRPKRFDIIGCFVCESFNGSNPACEDPFSPAPGQYEARCKQGMKGRVGEFPASYCVKMAGTSVTSGLQLTVRTCLLVSMHHQCGSFVFDDDRYSGCLSTCMEDGCNHATPTHHVTSGLIWLPLLGILKWVKIN